MKASIDRPNCIACGLCVSTCPEVFRMADDGFAEVYTDPIPSKKEAEAAKARDGCPVSVITLE